MAKRKKSKLRIQQDGDELRLRARRGSCAIAAFMTFWMAGWTVGCAFIVTRFHWDMAFEDLIFPIPFLLGWVFGAMVWVSMLFANEELRLGPDGVRYRLRLSFIPTQRRNLPLSELKDVDSFTEREGSGSDTTITHGVELRTYGAPLRFGQALSSEDRTEAVRLVGKHLKMLKSLRSSTRREDANQTASDGLFATSATGGPEARSGGLLLDGQPGTFERPSECCYRLVRTFDGVDFVWRGKPMFLGSLVILALNLFWNTIVMVFVLQLFKDFRFDLFLFLIPFELIGLAMFIGFLAALFQPFFKERWRFTRAAIEHRFTVFWIGPRWHYEVIPLSHVELRRDEEGVKPFWERGKKKEEESGASGGVVAKGRGKRGGAPAKVRRPINLRPSQFGRDFMLEFVATDGEPLCTIKHLHEGEARWIADVVRGEFPGWFSR